MARTIFDTSQFVESHGHDPRGRGSWAFALKLGSEDVDIFWHNGLYTEARKAAKENFLKGRQKDETVRVYVLS